MLITSNGSVAEWGTVFGNPVVATAILDRLLHHSHVVTIRGDSYRLREKRKGGLMPRPDGAVHPVPRRFRRDLHRPSPSGLTIGRLHVEYHQRRGAAAPSARRAARGG